MAKTQFNSSSRVSPKSLLGLVAALIVAFLLLVSVLTVAQKYRGIRRHIGELATEQTQLQQKHTAIQAKNAYLATPEGTEEILREKYNVTKPGEGIVVIVDPGPTLPDEKEIPKRTWWQSILAGLGLR